MSNTSQVDSTVDVLSKYNSLVEQSLSGDSVYIRAKETMQELFEEGDINSTDKATAISTTVTNLVNAITGASMSTALEWAKYEKDLELKKLELDASLAVTALEAELKEAQVAQVKTQTRLALVESKRMYGAGNFSGEVLINIDDTGKVFTDMQLVEQNITNAATQKELIEANIGATRATTHKVVADTYTNFGTFDYTFKASGNGFTAINRTDGTVSLSDTQQEIAKEQGKGYTYNAWANALTGSASMLGTALASEVLTFGTGSPERALLYTVANCADNLNRASGTEDSAVPKSFVVPDAGT